MTADSRASRADIAFVFDDLPDWQQLAAAAQEAGLEVAVLSGVQDGLVQMADYLQGRSGIGAIHLIAHGQSGAFQLGSIKIDSASLPQHADVLARIGAALHEEGDLLLYGCQVAAGETGQAFIHAIARLTQADVAASSNHTGAARLGGDWVLEARSGSIEAGTLAVAGYDGLLAANTPPVAHDNSFFIHKNQDLVVSLATLLANDYDIDSDLLSVITIQSAVNGTLYFVGGNIVFTPTAEYVGPASFGYTISDGKGGSKTATVQIAVEQGNPPPVAVNDSLTATEDTSVTFAATQFLSNDSDPTGGGLHISSVGSGTGGNALLNPDGTVTFTPHANFNGAAHFDYTISDNQGGSATANAKVVVAAVNDMPSFLTVGDGTAAFTKGGAAVVLDVDVAIRDVELDALNGGLGNYAGASLTLARNGGANADDQFSASGTLGALTTGAALSVGGTTIGSVTTNSAGTLELSFNASATTALVNQALRQIAYSNTSNTPPTTVQLDWLFSDGNTGAQGSGGAGLASGSTTVNITGGNFAPTGLHISNLNVAEDATTVTGLTIGTLSTSDVDVGDTFSYSIVGGTDQQYVEVVGNELRFKAGTQLNFEVKNSYSITVRTTDAGGLYHDKAVVVSITDANDAPTVQHPLLDQTATALQPLSYTWAAGSFTDEDAGQTLTYTANLAGGSPLPSWLAFNPSTGTFSGSPSRSDAGVLNIEVRATDNGVGSLSVTDTFTLTVNSLAMGVPTLALATGNDTGASNSDGITALATPTITGQAEAGSTVTVYSNGTALGFATADGNGAWSFTPHTALADTVHTITATASDGAGNVSAASAPLQITVDTQAPVFASASVQDQTLVLNYTNSGPLDASNLPDASAFAVLVDGVARAVSSVAINASAKTVTLTLATPVAAGQQVTLAYADSTTGDDLHAIQDIAGNDAVTLAMTVVTNNTPAPAPPPQPQPQPQPDSQPNPPTAVDGALVTTTPGPNGANIVSIGVVTPSRNDDPNSTNSTLADIPLVRAPDGRPILQVGVPVGVGLQAEGLPIATTGAAALQELGFRIERISGSNSALINAGQVFYATLGPNEPLHVQIIRPIVGEGFDPSTPLLITGSSIPADGKQAVILDARNLPSGTTVQIDNVEFVAVAGDVRLIGGAGQNAASGDNGAQWMVLGADDDVLHGGGGNDTVGSLSGNDQVFGDAGNDIVFGGTGHDTLSGGSGNDRLDGGLGWDTALQIGSVADYTLRTEGQFLVMTHKTTGEVDRLKSIETVQFDSGATLYIADSNAEAALAHIVTTWLGRDLTPAEGAWAQQHSGLSDLQVAQVLLNVSYAPELQGHTAEELVAGWQGNPQIVRMDVASEHLQGTAGLDQMHIGLNLADLSLERTGSDRWEGTSRIDGDMAEFLGIERLHLKDVSVALDTHGSAGQLAALLSVTLGSSALDNKGLVGEGLAALDAGMSVQAVGNIALSLAQAQQGHPFTAQETVQWLWTQATGSAGSMQQLQPLVDGLERGQLSAGALAEAAARYALEHPSVQLLGVLEQGLLYTPV